MLTPEEEEDSAEAPVSFFPSCFAICQPSLAVNKSRLGTADGEGAGRARRTDSGAHALSLISS